MKEATQTPPSEDPATQAPSLSPGMAALLRRGGAASEPATQLPSSPHSSAASATDTGQNPDPSPGEGTAENGTSAATGRSRLLRISLIVADVLLAGLAATLVFKSGGHFGFAEATLCVVALLLGAWLTCLALWLD
jgi:hypothetical protein